MSEVHPTIMIGLYEHVVHNYQMKQTNKQPRRKGRQPWLVAFSPSCGDFFRHRTITMCLFPIDLLNINMIAAIQCIVDMKFVIF